MYRDSLYYFCNFLSICNYFKIKSLKKYKPTDHWSRSDCCKSLQTLVSISVLGNKLSQLALAKRLQLSVNSLFLLQLLCIFTMLFNLYLSSSTSTSLLICSKLFTVHLFSAKTQGYENEQGPYYLCLFSKSGDFLKLRYN